MLLFARFQVQVMWHRFLPVGSVSTVYILFLNYDTPCWKLLYLLPPRNYANVTGETFKIDKNVFQGRLFVAEV